MPNISIPSVATLIREIDELPNVVLERAYMECKTGGIKRYGRRQKVHPEIIEEIRKEINRRNSRGRYYFSSKAEKERMRRFQPKIEVA